MLSRRDGDTFVSLLPFSLQMISCVLLLLLLLLLLFLLLFVVLYLWFDDS